MAVALKAQDTVHHMLQDLGARDGPFLIDVADDEDCDAPALCELHEGKGAVFHLGDAAGSGV